MIFTKNALIGICASIYVLGWLVMLCVYLFYNRYARKINVHTEALLYSGTVFVRLWGWFGALLLCFFLIASLPSVQIITQDRERKIAQEKAMEKKYSWYKANYDFSERQSFFCDEYYVLFGYNGQTILSGKYIHNKTDSVLNLYKTSVSLGGICSVFKGPDDDIYIEPGQMRAFPAIIESKFERPDMILKKDEYFKYTWTLDLKGQAQLEKEIIRRESERREKFNQKALE